jgi:hypothetical protein
VTHNVRAFRVLVRNALFRRVELAALGRYNDLGELDRADGADGMDADAWHAALDAYAADHDSIGTHADARGPRMLQITAEPGRWVVRQVLADPAEDHDWGIDAVVDLVASDETGTAVVRVTGMTRL